ncbi:hypothetical protein GCM10010437_009220 [Actinoplanes palleronii]
MTSWARRFRPPTPHQDRLRLTGIGDRAAGAQGCLTAADTPLSASRSRAAGVQGCLTAAETPLSASRAEREPPREEAAGVQGCLGGAEGTLSASWGVRGAMARVWGRL